MKKYHVAVVGATGLVGRKLISVLQARNFPIKELHLFASEKSIGRCIYACGKYRRVKTITKNSFFKIVTYRQQWAKILLL